MSKIGAFRKVVKFKSMMAFDENGNQPPRLQGDCLEELFNITEEDEVEGRAYAKPDRVRLKPGDVIVDLTTAGMVVQAYEGCSPEVQEKLEKKTMLGIINLILR